MSSITRVGAPLSCPHSGQQAVQSDASVSGTDTRDSNVWIHLRLSAGVVERIINVIVVSGISRQDSQSRQLFPSDSRLRWWQDCCRIRGRCRMQQGAGFDSKWIQSRDHAAKRGTQARDISHFDRAADSHLNSRHRNHV